MQTFEVIKGLVEWHVTLGETEDRSKLCLGIRSWAGVLKKTTHPVGGTCRGAAAVLVHICRLRAVLGNLVDGAVG